MRRFRLIIPIFLIASTTVSNAWIPLPVAEDRLVFMPGTQPHTLVTELQTAEKCDNCHGGYDKQVEPAYNWRGSMMSQAARDPLWLACLVVAAQDSIWALGNPNAADLCVRCHSPAGWLGGRSDPSNLTALDINQADYEGVHCDSCHRMVDPFLALGQPDLPAETAAEAITAAAQTAARDWTLTLLNNTLFDGSLMFDGVTKLPANYAGGGWPNYVEAASGQYFMNPEVDKRGNRWDANPKSHVVYYSRFHKSKGMCSTCHDVSNPVLANLVIGQGTPEMQAAGSYFHVERTWSEFQLSAFAEYGGAATDTEYSERSGVEHAASCQDCHMRKTVGKAANKNILTRPDLALHDLTGGNTWITRILATADMNGTAYDPYNYAILSGDKYPGAFIETGGLQNQGAALLAGELRARENLRSAADLQVISDLTSEAVVRIRNLTGHKLISGFPEGRRMWLQVEYFDKDGQLIHTTNGYDHLVARFDDNGNRVFESGGTLNVTREDLVYEAMMSSTLTGEDKTLHFVLATDRYKDNRIPPRGFKHGLAAGRLVQPRWMGQDAPDYFTPEEYAGGYDEVVLHKPAGTVAWRARLYYQTTSREYVEFLRDEANGTIHTLSSPTPSGEAQAYVAQTDPWFATIRDWGTAMYDLWLHNGGSPPEIMAETVSEPIFGECDFNPQSSQIRFLTVEGRTYQVEYSDDMSEGSWMPMGDPVPGDGSVVEIIDNQPLANGRRFYRIESELTGHL